MKLLTGNSNKVLSKNIAKYLKSKLVNSSIRKFADGEIYVEINENIRGNSIFIIQSVSSPANDNLMELLLCIDALKRSSAKNIIAVIHAGWKGAFKGIIKKVVSFMLKNKSKPENIIVAIGPCISQNSYNVKEDFKKKFIKKNKKNKMFFKIKNQIIYFDLLSYVKFQLKSCKISKIDVIKIDTFNEKNNFFSARRSLKLKHDDYGRNISIIMIN